jgi:tRNA A37 methylthiotransferase MiaB
MNEADFNCWHPNSNALGHRPAENGEGADIFVVNTCVVRQSAGG